MLEGPLALAVFPLAANAVAVEELAATFVVAVPRSMRYTSLASIFPAFLVEGAGVNFTLSGKVGKGIMTLGLCSRGQT